MQYTQAQRIAQAIWALTGNSEAVSELKSDSARYLDASKSHSMSAGNWQQCTPPTITYFNHWNHGHDSGNGLNGGRRIWRWIQIKNENWIYCLTETRQPIEGDPDGKWETVNTASRKPLILTEQAIAFFTKVQSRVELNFEEE